MNTIQRFKNGLITAVFIAPLTVAQNECGDAVIVSSGETLSKIAERCDTTVSAILDANRQLTDGDDITAGSILAMPEAGSRSPARQTGDAAAQLLAADEIDDLVAPIALYPDVLLSQVLPAATYPVEIVQAARWRKTHDDAEDADREDWAPSIKALVRYPDALNLLNDDLDWTVRLGDAFLAQPDDIFDGIQRMRTKAEAAGNLKDTEQQVIVREKTEVVEVIRIVPANPRYVYVPYYDPYAVYYPYRGARVVHHTPLISFSAGFALGSWMNYGLSWRQRHIYHHHYSPSYYRGHRHRVITRRNSGYPTVANIERGQRWRHDVNRSQRHHQRATVRSIGGNVQRNNSSARRDANHRRTSVHSRQQPRVNRLNNGSTRERNQQLINRAARQQLQSPPAVAGSIRGSRADSARSYRTNAAGRNEAARNRLDQPQQIRAQRQRIQSQRSVAGTRSAPSITRETNNQAPRRQVQPQIRAQSRPQQVQRRAAPPARASMPQRNTVRINRPQATPQNRSINVQRSQPSRSSRASNSNRNEQVTRARSRERSSNRANNRPGRVHVQQR